MKRRGRVTSSDEPVSCTINGMGGIVRKKRERSQRSELENGKKARGKLHAPASGLSEKIESKKGRYCDSDVEAIGLSSLNRSEGCPALGLFLGQRIEE